MSDDRTLAALRPVVATFERLGIAYQIGGSVASSLIALQSIRDVARRSVRRSSRRRQRSIRSKPSRCGSRAITGKAHNRAFRHDRYSTILNEGTE